MKWLFYKLGLHKSVYQTGFNKFFSRFLYIFNFLPECGHFDTCMPVSTKFHCTRRQYIESRGCWHCGRDYDPLNTMLNLTFKRRLFSRP